MRGGPGFGGRWTRRRSQAHHPDPAGAALVTSAARRFCLRWDRFPSQPFLAACPPFVGGPGAFTAGLTLACCGAASWGPPTSESWAPPGHIPALGPASPFQGLRIQHQSPKAEQGCPEEAEESCRWERPLRADTGGRDARDGSGHGHRQVRGHQAEGPAQRRSMPLSPRLWGPGRTAHFASPTPASLHTGLALRVDLLREGQSRNAQASATSGRPVPRDGRNGPVRPTHQPVLESGLLLLLRVLTLASLSLALSAALLIPQHPRLGHSGPRQPSSIRRRTRQVSRDLTAGRLPAGRGRIPGGTREPLVGSAGPCENWGAPPSAFPPDGFFLHDRLQLTVLGEALDSEAHTQDAPR
ncbi:unnamed protein product [Rangifer tarandus platyrhynchus]|uniref:Uncharacterized protein n=2 Tax=Rangifer tarandus platyrhynchus TaxID=3082113 RepID=A0ACB0EZC1_RANTA|nr:unnamed protein product [Rangifer tarandus platyrhynchus]CAI9706031.1 unnamed protein product [Rangifer tarandus platyrhynchus]